MKSFTLKTFSDRTKSFGSTTYKFKGFNSMVDKLAKGKPEEYLAKMARVIANFELLKSYGEFPKLLQNDFIRDKFDIAKLLLSHKSSDNYLRKYVSEKELSEMMPIILDLSDVKPDLMKSLTPRYTWKVLMKIYNNDNVLTLDDRNPFTELVKEGEIPKNLWDILK